MREGSSQSCGKSADVHPSSWSARGLRQILGFRRCDDAVSLESAQGIAAVARSRDARSVRAHACLDKKLDFLISTSKRLRSAGVTPGIRRA